MPNNSHTLLEHNAYTPHRQTVRARWLLWLRWFAAIGQLATVLTAAFYWKVALPLGPLLNVIGFTAITNLALEIWVWKRRKQAPHDTQRMEQSMLATVMSLDLLSLTVLLYFTGGVANPFVVFFFVNVALSAAILPASWAWVLTGAAIGCATLLYFVHRPLAMLESNEPGDVTLTRCGLIIALATCEFVVTYFITRVTRELREREQQLFVAEQQRSRAERLESLATLAAGAGHELASPLSTIAVIAGELNHHLEGANVPETVLEDVALIRTELAHCRSILDRLSGHAGEAAGEAVEDLTVEELIGEVLAGMRHPERVEVKLHDQTASQQLRAPLQAIAQAMRGVVQNGLDASPDGQPVTISGSNDQDFVTIKIVDRGNGMPPKVLRRVGEPFYTTKETGKGMGLGIFLTRNVIERLGGNLELQSKEGQGTTASIRLPKHGQV